MNEHAGREREIEARHHACSYLPSAVEICTVCFLLAQLREARETLAAVAAMGKGLKGRLRRGQTVVSTVWVMDEIDRILKGGD